MSSFAPLRHSAFRLLVLGRTVNTLGSTFAPIALAFAVLDLTGSASDLGLVVGTRTIANVVFLLFGGVLADRLPRHLLMVGTSALAAITQGTVAALVLTHTATIPLIIALSAVNGMVSAVSMPASSAILPQTVPADERQQANALNRLSLNGAAVIGAPAGGLVVATVGPGWGIMVDAVTFVLAGACFAALRMPGMRQTPTGGEARKNIFADLLTGWGEFRARTWLWVVVAGACVLNASWSGGINVLGPVVADDTIGRGAWGLVLAAETVGMILGGLVAMRLRLRRLLFFGVANTIFMGLPVLVLGVYPELWALLVAGLLSGLTLEQFGIAWETTMQEHVPADKLARVYSYDMVGSFVAIPVGQMAIGPIADVAGLEPTLVGAAVLITASALLMLSSRDVRTLAHKLPEPAPQPMEESVR